MKITIELTAEQVVSFNEIKSTRTNKTDEQLLGQLVERGLYDLAYRTKRNRAQYAEFKAYKESLTSQQ